MTTRRLLLPTKDTAMAETRIETDTMGEVEVPADGYWGAQTERSHRNFPIGYERMPVALVHAFGLQKKPLRSPT